MRLGMLALLSTLVAGCVEPAPARAPAAVSLHAYYLFRFWPLELSEYIPLIVTREPLEALVAAKGETPVVLITTYERDSIWSLERDVPLSTAKLSPAERGLRLRDVEYRYQEIAPAEVLHLLEDPGGSISINRTHAPPARESMQDLIAGLGGGNGR